MVRYAGPTGQPAPRTTGPDLSTCQTPQTMRFDGIAAPPGLGVDWRTSRRDVSSDSLEDFHHPKDAVHTAHERDSARDMSGLTDIVSLSAVPPKRVLPYFLTHEASKVKTIRDR